MSDSQKDLMRFDRAALEDVLRQAGAVVASGAKQIRCPFHDDRTPSASISQGPSGNWQFRCFTCGVTMDYWDILSRVTGTPVGELLKEANGTGSNYRSGHAVERASSPATGKTGDEPYQSGPPPLLRDFRPGINMPEMGHHRTVKPGNHNK